MKRRQESEFVIQIPDSCLPSPDSYLLSPVSFPYVLNDQIPNLVDDCRNDGESETFVQH